MAAFDQLVPVTAGAKTPDRRQSARSQLFTLVDVRGSPDRLWAWDIGLGGMQCRGRTPRWPGTYLDLSFTLPGTNDDLEVGSQVLTLDQTGQSELTLGLRFCMLSAKAQRAIYRFLDFRRALWSDGRAQPETPLARLSQLVSQQKRPFEALLLEAYANIRARELQRMHFIRSINKSELPPLSSLVA